MHLGDYLYEYDAENYPSDKQRVDGRQPDPLNELIHLADYRLRYASYRRDPDLARLHQLYPMISVFDDHESANDSWRGGAENHTPETEGPGRRASARRCARGPNGCRSATSRGRATTSAISPRCSGSRPG